MPNWSEILDEINISGALSILDETREKYLKKLHDITGRNIIAYYSGWLEYKTSSPKISINDLDMNGFMNAINGLDTTKGLDLILHTPGGDIAATEAIVRYLRTKFNNDIRVIVPQIAMSAGTMIACSSKEIIMGRQSNLGPADPQFGTIPAQGVLDEFEKAKKEIASDPSTIPVWQTLLSKYPPTFIGECNLAIKWAQDLVTEWLKCNMLAEKTDSDIALIVQQLLDHDSTRSHSRHLGPDQCRHIGLKIKLMEDNQDLQEAILSVHHAFMISISSSTSPIAKIIENQIAARTVYFG